LLQPADFLPVRVTDASAVGDRGCSAPSMASRHVVSQDGRVEIILSDGTTIRAEHDVSLATLRRVLAALRG
jgi:hypothetical protein